MRLFELVLGVLHRLAERAVVLVVVEDLHWADQSTRDLVGFLVRNLRGGVALVVTYRSDELHRRHPLRPFLAELDRSGRVERLELGRLGRRELGELVAGILGGPAAPGLVAEVLARSEGNPVFAEELVAAQLEGARLPSVLRELEALLAQGAPRSAAGAALAKAWNLAGGLGARLLVAEIDSLSRRARIELAGPPGGGAPDDPAAAATATDELGLTPREREVLAPGRRRPHQPPDRRGPVHQRQDGQRARLQHPGQARRGQPGRGHRRRPPPPPHRLGLRPPGGPDRRSHSQDRVGCMVWSTTASSSPVRVARSTSSRRRVPKVAIVPAAS
jgi:hypothetical protein